MGYGFWVVFDHHLVCLHSESMIGFDTFHDLCRRAMEALNQVLLDYRLTSGGPVDRSSCHGRAGHECRDLDAAGNPEAGHTGEIHRSMMADRDDMGLRRADSCSASEEYVEGDSHKKVSLGSMISSWF